MRPILFFILLSIAHTCGAQVFHSFDELKAYADTASVVNDQVRLQNKLARNTSLAAKGNTLNPRIPVTASLTDNTHLQVSFIPAQVFGGPEGSFREITMGQQYISSLTVTPQFDIINPGKIADVRTAKTNEELVRLQGLQAKKDLYDNLNAVYHNIVSLQAQIGELKRFASIADSIYQLTRSKYDAGILRIQDVNDAEVNVLQYRNKLRQAEINLEQQYFTLSVLCDTDKTLEINTEMNALANGLDAMHASSDLNARILLMKEMYARRDYASTKWQNLPVLSFVSSFAQQNNSNKQFLDNDQRWIYSSYVGLRLTWDFPTSVQKLATMSNSKLNYELAVFNAQHAALQNKLQNEQLDNDYEKALGDYTTSLSIRKKEEETFALLYEQYALDIISLDRLLTAQQKVLNARLNELSALATVAFNKEKITINNQVK